MNKNVTPKDMNNLSAYLDGQLSTKDRLKVETRLRNEKALQQGLRELRQTKLLLKQATNIPIPHSFTLTPEIAAQIKPARRSGMLPALSISSALAAFLLVFALLFELLPGFQNQISASKSATGNTLLMEAAAPMEDSAVQPPMILEWGNPSLKGIGGYGSGGGGSDVNGMGGGFAVMEAPQPETGLVPPDVVGGGEPEQITPQATAELRAALEPVTGSGPILGIRSEEETQIYNDAVMGILDEQINNYQPPSGNTIPLIRWLQISLAAITVVTGISALFVWKRLRF